MNNNKWKFSFTIILVFLLITITYADLTECNGKNYWKKESLGSENTIPSSSGKFSNKCEVKRDLLNKENIISLKASINKCNSMNISCELSANNKYRTMDGSCNNLKNPHWGKANICLQRSLPFDYGDGVFTLRSSASGYPLPNARILSNELTAQTEQAFEDDLTTLFMIWGQVVAHDLAHSHIYESSGKDKIKCCNPSPVMSDKCMGINIPEDDPYYSKFKLRCLDTKRSEPCKCNGGKRVHVNKNTAFQDLSLVYGKTEEDSKFLRSFIRGMLKVQYTPVSGELLPGVAVEDFCHSKPEENACYKSGDVRTNQNTILLTAHTLLMRNHNNICEELYKVHKDWDDERIFQEARRIHIAQVQYITYASYLPLVLGKFLDDYDLRVSSDDLKFTEYDPELDPSVGDEYLTVACRYGHTFIPESVLLIDPVSGAWNTSYITSTKPHKGFQLNGQYEKMIRGMLIDRIMKSDRFLSDSIRNHLFKGMFGENIGNDLSSMTILRGRDHGIPGYTYYQKLYKGNDINSFEDLKSLMSEDVVELLKASYKCVHDIDFYIGGLVEDIAQNALVGPTIAEVLGEQYKRIKFGDRYWFEHRNQAGSFTPEQLREIKRTSLAKIICDASTLEEVQLNPFKVPSDENPVVPCTQISNIDFSVF